MKSKKKTKLVCVFESTNEEHAKESYRFYNITKKDTRLTRAKGIFRVWVRR